MLGLLWLLDGMLQYKPAMWTRSFADQVIAPAAAGQPGFISGPASVMAWVILRQPAILNGVFGLVQLALGVGLLYPRTARRALAASIVWALLVWYLGEGLGGLFGSTASLLTGAPGAALLYAVLGLAAALGREADAGAPLASRWPVIAWAVLWAGGAVLQLLPGRDTNALIAMSLAMNAAHAPAWFAAAENHLAALMPGYGVSVVADLVVLQALVGLGVFRGGRMRRAAVLLGIGLSAVYWFAGQEMGQFWSGMSTDPNTAPLVVLLGLVLLSSRPHPPAAAGQEAAGPLSAARPPLPPGRHPVTGG